MHNPNTTAMMSSAYLLEIQKMYSNCIKELTTARLLTPLSSKNKGFVGEDKQEYPVPTLEQILTFFEINSKLVNKKFIQGFNCLRLIPLGMSINTLIQMIDQALERHDEKELLFRQRNTLNEVAVPVKLNKDKRVWEWEALYEMIKEDKLIYFPESFSLSHKGFKKYEVVSNSHFCLVPGWSVCLSEPPGFMPEQGKGLILGGRKQLEIGFSPNDYRAILRKEAYEGETGKTLEDFLVLFLIHLENRNEVCFDMDDNNALWCLGNYLEIPHARLVLTGHWFRMVGTLRIDAHRTTNKRYTKNLGTSTLVRLKGSRY